jgi:hypothetical protein
MPMASPKFPILVIGFPWQNLRDRQPFNAESFLPPIADRGSHEMGDSDFGCHERKQQRLWPLERSWMFVSLS